MKDIEGVGKIYTGIEIAEILNVSIYTVMRHYRLGNLKGRKVGNTVLFLDTSLQQFLSGALPKKRPSRLKPKNDPIEADPIKPIIKPSKIALVPDIFIKKLFIPVLIAATGPPIM